MRQVKNKLPMEKCYLSGSIALKLSALLYSSVITIFFIERNISYTQIGVIWSILLASQMITDYPTGGLADKIGRLKVFMIGMIISALSDICYVLGYKYIFILYLGAFLAGFGEAQISGTLLPWLISEYKKENNYEKKIIVSLISKNQMYTSFVGILLGIFIYFIKLDASFVLLTSAFINMAGGILVYLLWNDNKSEIKYSYLNLHKRTFSVFLREKRLWVYTIILTTGFINFSVYQFLWQPKIATFNDDKGIFTLINSIALLLVILVSQYVKKTDVTKKSAFVSLFSFGGLLLLIFAGNIYLTLIAIFIYRAAKAYKFPIINAYIHEYIPDDVRSSTTSLVSTVSSVILIVLQPLIGFALDKDRHVLIFIILLLNFFVEVFCLTKVVKSYNPEIKK